MKWNSIYMAKYYVLHEVTKKRTERRINITTRCLPSRATDGDQQS